MRAFAFIAGTLLYAVAGIFIYLQFLLQCGLGPDSPNVCNDQVDQRLPSVIATLIAVYVIGVLLIWRRRSKGEG